MKINLSGYYRDVVRWVNENPSPQPKADSAFRKLLSDCLPESQKKDTDIRELRAPERTAEQNVLARYNFAPPQPLLPETAPPALGPPQNGNEVNVKELAPSVKPPVVVSARRVPATSITSEEKLALRKLIDSKGRQNGMDPALSLAVAKAESAFNPHAVSGDGHNSKGLFQLLDTTGRDLKQRLDIEGKYNPFNPELNAELGVNYLRYLHDIFSKSTPLPGSLETQAAQDAGSLEKLAVAAFNAGEGRVASAQARAKAQGADPSNYDEVEQFLPESTQQYVRRVVQFRDEFEEEEYG